MAITRSMKKVPLFICANDVAEMKVAIGKKNRIIKYLTTKLQLAKFEIEDQEVTIMQQLLYTDALQTKFDDVARQSQILTGDDLQLAIRNIRSRQIRYP